MCSVVGYIGKSLSRAFVFEGLSRLEYRGYDSAGFECLETESNQLACVKASGQLSNLVQRIAHNPIDGFVGIGHTRWSTHGDFSEKNAHPHFDCTKAISVVHNGVIENYHQLREHLVSAGHVFESSTDSEVITHLFEYLLLETADFKSAVCSLVQKLEGMFSFVIMMKQFPDLLLVARKRSPLCVGYGEGEMFVASDVLAFSEQTNKMFFLPDESVAYVYKDAVQLYDFFGKSLPIVTQPFSATKTCVDKGTYEHFMLKEIDEQRTVIENTVYALSQLGLLLWEQLGISAVDSQKLQKIVLIGCGTSWHAARIAQFFFETACKIPVEIILASECQQTSFFPDKKALYVFISQSGETADTLEVLRLITSYDLRTVALTNVATSTIVRQAQGFLVTQAGAEIAVASTKAFSTQLTALYWLANRLALCINGNQSTPMMQVENDLMHAAYLLELNVSTYRQRIVADVAVRYASYDKAIFLGKESSYPFAMESALKLKEIAYVFAQAYPVGELKHGPLALVDSSVPVYIFSHSDPFVYKKLLSNAQAVYSRGGKIIAFVYEGQDELCSIAETFFVIVGTISPLLGPLVMTGLMQFLMYSIAKSRNCPIDKPRNLAKSVTVE